MFFQGLYLKLTAWFVRKTFCSEKNRYQSTVQELACKPRGLLPTSPPVAFHYQAVKCRTPYALGVWSICLLQTSWNLGNSFFFKSVHVNQHLKLESCLISKTVSSSFLCLYWQRSEEILLVLKCHCTCQATCESTMVSYSLEGSSLPCRRQNTVEYYPH